MRESTKSKLIIIIIIIIMTMIIYEIYDGRNAAHSASRRAS